MSRSRVLGLIPARGGSKRLPGKNLADLHGRSLLQRAIDAGLAARGIDRLIVSTDDPAIAEAARAGGAEVPFLRPAELATDEASSLDVVRHAMDWADQDEPGAFSHLVLLQPTSPLRTAGDIDQTLTLCRDQDRSTAVSVTPAPKPDVLMIGQGGVLRPASEYGHPLILNGAVYVLKWDHLNIGGAFIAPDTAYHVMDQHRSVDVDTSDDLDRAAKS
ncbi:acylneuraminate cytidylyltransferase family protein [Brevundimonas denitrificans]|uniref:acylneuraminate cytidylyltransferase family protein n=1 Tax=Brevundimonas denitrificans TaxID=1443434 RepID=UPI00223B803E|nr:acylneuraminate cytidylyltransferase family protein [Brevundimonas denitrificans]